MRVVTIHAAKTNLSKLIENACKGEEIVIARGSQPVARLVPFEPRVRKREPGTLKGKIVMPPSFFDPLPDDELDSWGQ